MEPSHLKLVVEHREQLFGLLATREAKWLMSFDDCAEVRSLPAQLAYQVRIATTAGGPERPSITRVSITASNPPDGFPAAFSSISR